MAARQSSSSRKHQLAHWTTPSLTPLEATISSRSPARGRIRAGAGAAHGHVGAVIGLIVAIFGLEAIVDGAGMLDLHEAAPGVVGVGDCLRRVSTSGCQANRGDRGGELQPGMFCHELVPPE